MIVSEIGGLNARVRKKKWRKQNERIIVCKEKM